MKYELEAYIGRRVGKRVIIGPETRTSTSGIRCWRVRCDCGKVDDVNIYYLVGGDAQSCVHCRKARQEAYGPIGPWAMRQLANLRRTGTHEVTVTADDLVKLWEEQRGKCALTGLDLVFASSFKDRLEQTASLDRIDSAYGYVHGNVQWVHKHVNIMKNKFPQAYFESICLLVARNVHARLTAV